MTGDYMTKPLTGAKFNKFRTQIMNTGWKIESVDSRSVLENIYFIYLIYT
jgi:hypothetical protein